MTMKVCRICGVPKPFIAYSRNRSRKDGLHYNCKPCDSAKTMAWERANPARAKAKKQKWRADNLARLRAADLARYHADIPSALAARREYYKRDPAKVIARVQKYQRARPEQVAGKLREWRHNNRGKTRQYAGTRRATELQATPKWLSAVQRAQIQEMYDVAIALTTQTQVVHHVDHIEPLRAKHSRGLHVPWNLQVLPWYVNLSKSNRMSPAPIASPARP